MDLGGITKTTLFRETGLSNYDVYNLCNAGMIECIRHVYYQLKATADISEEYLLSTLQPDGVVCVESALFHYGYSDFTPREWSIAVPRTIARSRLKIDAIPHERKKSLTVYWV